MAWNIDDDKMCNSVIDELLSIIDAYEFTCENPHSTEADKENTEKGIAFKYKQIEWLSGLKDRIMTPEEKDEREKKNIRLVEVCEGLNHIDNQIRNIYGYTCQAGVVMLDIQQMQQVKPLEEKKKELQEELNKLRCETL